MERQSRQRNDAIRRLEDHGVYAAVRDRRSLQVFMEHHVVCVLDFMSLLKQLQAQLTCVASPWVPSADPVAARLINSIVLDEESDDAFGPTPASHYGWYLAAMEQVGADTGPIRELESQLRAGRDPIDAVMGCDLPPAAARFARTTFELAHGPTHVVAAAFVHGREVVIPKMFVQLVDELKATGLPCDLFCRYLERHIQVDADEHGPAARAMLDRLLAGDERRGAEAHDAALRALEARELLFDAMQAACETVQSSERCADEVGV